MVSLTGDEGNAQRDGKRNTTVTVIVAIVAVVAIVLLSLLYWYGAFPWLFDEDPRYSHSFTLTIAPDLVLGFRVICPVPVNESGSPYPMFAEELEFTSGDPQCSLIDTEYGQGLQVSGQGYTRLHWDGDWKEGEEDWYLNLSMTNTPLSWDHETPGEGFWAWICSGNETFTMKLSYSAERIHNETPRFISGGGPHFYLSATITEDGWHQVLLDYGWIIIN